MSDVYEHMKEAWKLEKNPFPAEAIRIHNAEQPYSASVFPEETQEFRIKFILGGTLGGQVIGFLWSEGVGGDTGYGKTTLLQEMSHEINNDLGAQTLEMAGAKKEALPAIAAAFSNLNNLNAAGLYPVLFDAVVDLATAPNSDAEPVLDRAHARIIEELGTDNAKGIAENVRAAWSDIGGTSALRAELVDAFARGGGRQLKMELGSVSSAARSRNGLQYLDFALAVLAAAKIEHLYLMIDQLEDLATNRSITVPKRSREVGRIRDLLESAPYATRLHMIFTFHNRAAIALERYWEENRLPPFEVSSSNTSCVVLRGLKDGEQTKELLRVHLEDARMGDVEDALLPFEPASRQVLLDVADGRTGVLLSRARSLLNAAAERELPKITGKFARQYFDNQAPEVSDGGAAPDETLEDIDDLLLGAH